jgi:hypothetical protein
MASCGGGYSNGATFRLIFDGELTSSEFSFVMAGTAGVLGNPSPVMATRAAQVWPDNVQASAPQAVSLPFIFNSRICQFCIIDKTVGPTTSVVVALYAMELAPRSLLQASGCWLCAGNPASENCPGAAGDTGSLWPHQHPVGYAHAIFYPTNMFSGIRWITEGAEAGVDSGAFAPRPDQIVVTSERVDNPLLGTPGVREVLYFIARRFATDLPGHPIPIQRKLIRWDGATQTTESITMPDNLPQSTLGLQGAGRPYLATGGAPDWAAYKNEAGTWVAITGCLPPPSGGFTTVTVTAVKALSWGGLGYLLVNIVRNNGTDHNRISVYKQSATDFDTLVVELDSQTAEIPLALDAVIAGRRIYVLFQVTGGFPAGIVTVGLLVADLVTQTVLVARGVIDFWDAGTGPAPDLASVWIQNSGGRVYVGGRFSKDVPTGVVGLTRHAVYDVTQAITAAGVITVHEVFADDLEGSYSIGAIPATPAGDSASEGFVG